MTVLLLLAVVVLVLLNGFFVAAEFALVRVRRGRRSRRTPRRASAAPASCCASSTICRSYLAACQLGITFTSLGIGFLGEPAVADLIEEVLGESVPHGVSLAISFGLAYLITTSLHITIGEQVPEDLRDQPGRAGRALDRAGRCTCSRRSSTRSSTSSTAASNWMLQAGRRSAAPTSTRRAARPRSSRC